jgi:phage-related protein
MISLAFGATDISTGDYIVTGTDAFSAPKKKSEIVQLARRDGSVKLYDRLEGRSILVEGTIVSDDPAALRASMDALKALLLVGERALRITEDGSYREWGSAELANINVSREAQALTYAAFSAEFYSGDPFAIDGVTDTLVNQAAHTAATGAFAITAGGTYYAAPDITITLTAISPTNSDVNIVVGNPATSQYLTLSETWAAGDVITIDTLNKKAYRNANLIDAEGQFPLWLPGSGTFEYSDTATSRTVAISATNQRKWL